MTRILLFRVLYSGPLFSETPPFPEQQKRLRPQSQAPRPRLRVACQRRAPVREMFVHMGGCQSYGPFLGSYYHTAPII